MLSSIFPLPIGLPPLLSSAVLQLTTPPSVSTVLASLDNSSLAWLLQSLSCDPRASAAGSSERVLVDQGLPAIPKIIHNWEYVDLAMQFPTSITQHSTQVNSPLVARCSLFLGCVVIRQKSRQINSIADWIQVFVVFMAAIVSKHPSITLELVAYTLTILKASQQYDGLYWRSYDTNYRITAVASGNRAWSRLKASHCACRVFSLPCEGEIQSLWTLLVLC